MKLIYILAFFAILLVGFYGMRFMHFLDHGVFAFKPDSKSISDPSFVGVEEIPFKSEDGAEVVVWAKKAQGDKPTVLSFYGNFTNLHSSFERLTRLTDQGYGLVMLRYRGAHNDFNSPTEDAINIDARALYDQLDDLLGQRIPATKRILHGYSLGSGVATNLATEREAKLLVVEAGFDRLCKYFTKEQKGLPMCWLMRKNRYDSVDKIGKVKFPKLFIHGQKDPVLPIKWSKNLFDAASEPKEFVSYEEGTHVNLHTLGLIDDIERYETNLP